MRKEALRKHARPIPIWTRSSLTKLDYIIYRNLIPDSQPKIPFPVTGISRHDDWISASKHAELSILHHLDSLMPPKGRGRKNLCANPLFRDWLFEWWEDSKSSAARGGSTKMQWIYKKVHQSCHVKTKRTVFLTSVQTGLRGHVQISYSTSLRSGRQGCGGHRRSDCSNAG